jgi:hypothetical protein
MAILAVNNTAFEVAISARPHARPVWRRKTASRPCAAGNAGESLHLGVPRHFRKIAAEDVKEQCLDSGMDDFLGKPVLPDELTEMVRRYVAEVPRDP